jgi:hypothetical protein
MLLPILQHVPRWVWMLLAVLIALGISQSYTRHRTLRSATLVPVIMIILSFAGVVSTFAQPVALGTWAVGVACALVLSNAVGAWRNIAWSEQDQRLVVPGSWIPLMLILGLFVLKFSVGVALAMNHELLSNAVFALAVSFAYGAFSGMFFSRGVAMWKAAHRALQFGIANQERGKLHSR